MSHVAFTANHVRDISDVTPAPIHQVPTSSKIWTLRVKDSKKSDFKGGSNLSDLVWVVRKLQLGVFFLVSREAARQGMPPS
jgi:hypothetical protein